ncbi:glycosyltransferase family 2 protein [Ascidiimonas aurantiaca]|uniref:glycosyltransferase family 2 protein n=1 Tax=Ascidiimonas aurantiaca TaxID=1685432 RepID=UPI0030EC888E
MTISAILIVVCYALLLLWFVFGFYKLKAFTLPKNDVSLPTTFSVIIPFRNEAKNLPALLESLSLVQYPNTHWEVIFVNDHSEDESSEIITNYLKNHPEMEWQILHLDTVQGSAKKAAIEKAISHTKHNWVITTDADCTVPEKWLLCFHGFIRESPCRMVAAPVSYHPSRTFLNRFQLLDFLSLMGATMGGFGAGTPFMCNGANLAYEKNTFLAVNGFSGNKHIAGGDDIFLLEKINRKYAGSIKFLKAKEALVLTKPESSLRNLLAQRVRWAAKAASYKSFIAVFTGILVFLMNMLLLTLFSLFVYGTISYHMFLYVFVIKFNIDFLLLYPTALFLKQENTLTSYFQSSLIYPVFCSLVALRSFWGSYYWKGRKYKR